MLSQVPGVREGDFYWSNESFCLSGLFPLLFPCSWVFFRQMFDLFSPPTPSLCPHHSPCFGLWQVESYN